MNINLKTILWFVLLVVATSLLKTLLDYYMPIQSSPSVVSWSTFAIYFVSQFGGFAAAYFIMSFIMKRRLL